MSYQGVTSSPRAHIYILLSSYPSRSVTNEKCTRSALDPQTWQSGERDRSNNRRQQRSGPHRLRVPQDVASPPDRLNVVLPSGRLQELPTKLTNINIDDLLVRLVHSSVQVAEEHVLRDRGPLPCREQLEHLVLLRR